METIGRTTGAATATGKTVSYERAMSKVMKRNNIRRLTAAEVEDILVRIRTQATLVRNLKKQGVHLSDSELFWSEVFSLLDMKYTYNINSAVPVLNRELLCPMQKDALDIIFKIRWTIRGEDGSLVRLQRPFQNRTGLTGAEIQRAIQEQITKATKFPMVGGYVKIEFPPEKAAMSIAGNAEVDEQMPMLMTLQDSGESSTHVSYEERKPKKTLCDQDIFRIPLCFPGPRLANVYSLEFSVTFQEPPTNISTPLAYKSLSHRPELVDTGTNLFHKSFAEDPNVLHRAYVSGVTQLVLISEDIETSSSNLAMARLHLNTLYPTAGVHPHRVLDVDFAKGFQQLKQILAGSQKEIACIGECGISLDGDWKSQLGKQTEWFEAQLQLAADLHMPVLVHEKEGYQVVLDILSKYDSKIPAVVMNCFTGSENELMSYLSRGYYICITGFLCNDNRGAELRKFLHKIPLNQLVFGSDAPYMTPFNMNKPFPPHNEPATLPHVLVMAAECMGRPIQEVAAAATANTRRAFGLVSPCYNGLFPSESLTYSPNVRGTTRVPKAAVPTMKKRLKSETVAQPAEKKTEKKKKGWRRGRRKRPARKSSKSPPPPSSAGRATHSKSPPPRTSPATSPPSSRAAEPGRGRGRGSNVPSRRPFSPSRRARGSSSGR